MGHEWMNKKVQGKWGDLGYTEGAVANPRPRKAANKAVLRSAKGRHKHSAVKAVYPWLEGKKKKEGNGLVLQLERGIQVERTYPRELGW